MPAISQESEYLLHLLRCALREQTPDALPDGVSWDGVFRLAKTQGLSYFAYLACGDMVSAAAPAVAEKWNELNRKQLARYINQEHELTTLSRRFSRAGIDFMPIKGAAFCRSFPHPEARRMSDLDILIRPADFPVASRIMAEEGYSRHDAAEHHDEWLKLPYMIVELHRSLMPGHFLLGNYFKNPWKKAQPSALPHGYTLSVEDEYIYLLAHAAKHYHHFGMGIRYVLDVWLYQNTFAAKMDSDYISGEIKKIGLQAFSAAVEGLANAWFGDRSSKLTREELEMAHNVCEGSLYGKKENLELNIITDYVTRGGKSVAGAKRAYCLSLIYPPLYAMREKYPVLKKAPVLLPAYWVARHFRLVFLEPKTAVSRFKRVKELKLYHADEE